MRTLKFTWRFSLIVCVLAATALPTWVAYARPEGTTIRVNTVVDELNSNGNCSLREAIRAANLDAAVDGCPAGNGKDEIILPAGTYTLSIGGIDEDAALTGDLDITGNMRVSGRPGSTTIDGNSIDRVFHIVGTGAQVEFSDLIIQDGNAVDAVSYYGGGGILNNNGNVKISNSTFLNNQTNRFGGAVENTNLGILEVTNSTFHDNHADLAGGGISNSGTATIQSAVFYNNTSGQTGGGFDNEGSATLTNVTISGNTAVSGGGIFNDWQLNLLNCTISANSSGIANRGDTRTVSTIIANSVGGSDNNCTESIVTSEGNNLDSGNSCGFNDATDLNNSNPQLGPLGDNGGPTWTHPLLSDSPAIDTGNVFECPTYDQRGALRPADGNNDGTATCDIGAVEYNGTFPAYIYLPLIQR